MYRCSGRLVLLADGVLHADPPRGLPSARLAPGVLLAEWGVVVEFAWRGAELVGELLGQALVAPVNLSSQMRSARSSPSSVPTVSCSAAHRGCRPAHGGDGRSEGNECFVIKKARGRVLTTDQRRSTHCTPPPEPWPDAGTPAQDHLQGHPASQPVLLADRRYHRGSTGPAPRTRPQDLISQRRTALLEKARSVC
jgi:hypothetical protein